MKILWFCSRLPMWYDLLKQRLSNLLMGSSAKEFLRKVLRKILRNFAHCGLLCQGRVWKFRGGCGKFVENFLQWPLPKQPHKWIAERQFSEEVWNMKWTIRVTAHAIGVVLSKRRLFLPSRCLLESPFLEPLLRTPSKNASQNPSSLQNTLQDTF